MTRAQTSGDKIRSQISSTPSFSIDGRNFYRKGSQNDGTKVYVHLAKPEHAPTTYHVSTPAHNGYRLFWLFIKCAVFIVPLFAVLLKLGVPLY